MRARARALCAYNERASVPGIAMTLNEAQTVLARAGVEIAPGLTAEEFLRVERQFGFQFPPDLRAFLAIGLPVSGRWVDWRHADEAAIRVRLASGRDVLRHRTQHLLARGVGRT